jgi:hypothetical protein
MTTSVLVYKQEMLGMCQMDMWHFTPFYGLIAPLLPPINGFYAGNPRFGSSSIIHKLSNSRQANYAGTCRRTPVDLSSKMLC